MPTPSATQAAGDPHAALGCCSALPEALILPEAPSHHDQRSPTDTKPLPKAGGQLGTGQGKHWGPSLPPQDVLGVEAELGADAAGAQGDSAMCKGRWRRRDIVCPERKAEVRRESAVQGIPLVGTLGCPGVG